MLHPADPKHSFLRITGVSLKSLGAGVNDQLVLVAVTVSDADGAELLPMVDDVEPSGADLLAASTAPPTAATASRKNSQPMVVRTVPMMPVIRPAVRRRQVGRRCGRHGS